jgi:hypothetical protein
MAVRWSEQIRDVFAGNPARRIQSSVGGAAIVIGSYLLSRTDADRPLALSIALTGIYTLGRTAFNAVISRLGDSEKHSSVDLADEVVTANQAAVLALTGTTLGVLTAFTTGQLPPTTRAAVVALVAATLVQFAVQASGARKLGGMAWNLGLIGDFIAHTLFSFGLISLAAALVTRGAS